MQKKRLLSYGRDNLKSSIIREKIIIVNVEVEDAGRILRRAKKEAQLVAEKVDELEDRHWALLSQYRADQELETGSQEEEGTDDTGDVGAAIDEEIPGSSSSSSSSSTTDLDEGATSYIVSSQLNDKQILAIIYNTE